MESMTITEALAELKTLTKRVEKKRDFVVAYLVRQETFKDPLEKQGGSVSAIRAELQSIRDLEERLLSLRRGIQTANTIVEVTIGATTRTIAAWLVWRREVAPVRQQYLSRIRAEIVNARNQAQQKGLNIVAADGKTTSPTDVIVNVNESELAEQIEELETTLGTLDGQLSLKNATVTLTF